VTGERGAVPSVAAAGTAPCSPLLFSVKIGSSDGQNSRTGSVTVPMPRDTYSGAKVSRYHPATNRPLP